MKKVLRFFVIAFIALFIISGCGAKENLIKVTDKENETKEYTISELEDLQKNQLKFNSKYLGSVVEVEGTIDSIKEREYGLDSLEINGKTYFLQKHYTITLNTKKEDFIIEVILEPMTTSEVVEKFDVGDKVRITSNLYSVVKLASSGKTELRLYPFLEDIFGTTKTVITKVD